MKSRLLNIAFDSRESEGAKRFARHLGELLKLNDNVRQACLTALPKAREAVTEHQTDKIVEELSKRLDASAPAVEHSLAVLSFLTDALISEDIPVNDYKNWADDLLEAQWINVDQRAAFESVLTDLVSKHLPQLRSQSDARRARGGVLPKFQTLGITVEVRPIRKGRYRWGTPIEDYHPQIIGTASIASVHVGVDEGFPEDFYFQVDSTGIDNIVASFLAAKKEMAAMEGYLRLNQSREVEADAQ